MTYQDFKALEKKPEGLTTTLEDLNLGLDQVALDFYSTTLVFENLNNYSSLHDLLDYEYELESFEEVFAKHYPKYEPLAMPDFTEDDVWDSFYEFALFVDTGSEGYPVKYFNAENQFEEVTPTFEAFYDALTELKS